MQENSAISELMRITHNMDGITFRKSLETYLLKKLESKENTKEYLPLLVYQGNKKKDPEKDEGSLSIILDLHDWERYGYPIASEHTTRQINNWLLMEENRHLSKRTADRYDAFGDPYSDIGKPMPSVPLAFGNVGLRSMFKEQRCQFRYRNADDTSYPISMENRYVAQKSLKWISRNENENIMWQKIANDAILFVFPSKLPKIPLKFVKIFNRKDSGENPESFEEIAKNFISVIDGLPPEQNPKNIQIFALQQVPPLLSKRAKVAFTHNCTIESLINAAKVWQSGSKNLPNISCTKLNTPFPLQVSGIVNNVWRQNGELANQGKTVVKQVRYWYGMELLLNAPHESKLLHLLRGLLTHSAGLVFYVGNKLSKRETPKKHLEAIGRLFPLFGLLLHKCGCMKEDYMENTAYLIGQTLKISDGLHELYCEIKRAGDVPPQLVGNSMFVLAAETPVQALAQLGTRMCPYISWAKQYRTKREEKSNLAGWYLHLYENTISKLYSSFGGRNHFKFNDLEKAQLFIGYLAEFPKKDRTVLKSTDEEKEHE